MEARVKSVVNALNTDDFINAIRKHQVIWNPKHPNGTLKRFKEVAWDHVITLLLPQYQIETLKWKDCAKSMCQDKWEQLYDSYVIEASQTKEPYNNIQRKKGQYFDSLKFLSPTIDIEISDSSSTVDGLELDENNSLNIKNYTKRLCEDSDKNKHVTPIKKLKTSSGYQSTSLQQFGEKKCIVEQASNDKQSLNNNQNYEDHDKMFLLSLLPDLKALPDDEKLYVKSEILGTIWAGKQEALSWSARVKSASVSKRH